MPHTCYCHIPTPQEKKEMERQELQRKKNQNLESKTATRKRTVDCPKDDQMNQKKKTPAERKAKSKGVPYSELSASEKRKIDRLRDKHNAEMYKRFGLKEISGAEIRYVPNSLHIC